METINYCVNEKQIEIRQDEDTLEVNGKLIQVQLLPNPNGKVKILLNDEVLAFEVLERDLNSMVLAKDGKQYHVSKEALLVAEETQTIEAGPSKGTLIKAPLPGVVVKLLVQVGDAIKKDDVVLVVESMKMQIDVRSSTEGIVKGILVKPGDQVEVDMGVVEVE